MTSRTRTCYRVGMALAVLGIVALAADQARATIIPTLQSVTDNGNGTFTFNYRADVAQDQRAESGDFLTLYDFHGLVANSVTAPSGWSASVQNVGITPPSTLPTDDPTVVNITLHNTSIALTGPASFTFSAESDRGGVGAIVFAASATRNGGSLDGTKIANIGQVGGPSGTVGGQAVNAPEPATVVLLGMGLPAALLVLRTRRRARSA